MFPLPWAWLKRRAALAALLALLVIVGGLVMLSKYQARAYDPAVDAVVIEPARGPWKNNNRWGDQRVAFRMPAVDTPTQIVDGTEIVGPPRVQSVQLHRGTQQSGTNADFRARIEYGVGGMSGTFDLDWGDGVQFSLVANWVRVIALTYRPNPINPYDPATGIINIGASIAEGTVTPNRQATYTESQLITGAGSPGIFESPKFARAVIVWGGAAGGAQTVDFIGAGSLNPFTGTIASFATYRDFGMAFPGGCERVIVGADAADTTVTVQWLLGL